MLTPTQKKKRQKRQQDALKRKRGAADGISRRESRSSSGGGGSGDSNERLSRSTRSQSDSDSSDGQVKSRQRRANAVLVNNPSPSEVGQKSGSKKKEKKKALVTLPEKDANGKIPLKPKFHFLQGRNLFEVEVDGKKMSLPLKRDATESEKADGLFIPENDDTLQAIKGDVEPVEFEKPSKKVRPIFIESIGDRPVYAVEIGGKTAYLPRENDATALELATGKYIPENNKDYTLAKSISKKVSDDKPLRYDYHGRRTLFPTEIDGGGVEYLPRKSEANAVELYEGRYIEDDDIGDRATLGIVNPMGSGKPIVDRSHRFKEGQTFLRKLYPIKVDDRKQPIYLPRYSDASDDEIAKGLYIPDHTVDKYQRRRDRTALKDRSADRALGRAQRAKQQPGGIITSGGTAPLPVPEANDGTKLWDGFSLPEVSLQKQRETLEQLRPEYDPVHKRLLYPTEVAQGKIKYLPLREDASNWERAQGLYAAFVPLEPLEQFLEREDIAEDIFPQNFDTDEGEVRAYAQADIEAAFERAPQLVLRSAQFVSDVARETPELQQQFSD